VIEIFFLYLATWTVVSLTPGPAVLCAMSQATRYGFRQALAGIGGILLAHVVFFGCIAFGLAALLATATTAFAALRVAGALYLLYLGIAIVLATLGSRESSPAEATATLPARRSLLLQGFAIQVTNPKALLFMSALLPQFIRPEHALGLQLTVFFATTVVVDGLVLAGYAYFATQGARSLRGSGFVLWLERAFGAALVLFGVRLLAARK
jgi:homoserine/homoserine lactone efflux protein